MPQEACEYEILEAEMELTGEGVMHGAAYTAHALRVYNFVSHCTIIPTVILLQSVYPTA